MPPTSTAARLLDIGRADARQDATPEQIVEAVQRAGLRGRGGAGFPLAKKLEAVRANANGGTAYVVANGYDADPQSPIAKTLLARSAPLVMRGIALAARAVGAREAFLYLHPEAAGARGQAEAALASAEGVTVKIVLGPGGFMGGEESAMLAVLESRRAMARQRPPYPASQGLALRPTLVSSVETLAWLPLVLEGAAADTKLVSVTGSVARPGIYEVALGIPIGGILERAGGATGTLKGVHVGGPTGGILAAARTSTKYGFDELRAAGTHIGSGQVRAIPDSVCIVNEAAKLFTYLSKETCGICVPCRVGTKRVEGILEGVSSNLGRGDDLPWLDELADHLHDFSLCGFGITSSSIIRTTRAEFAEDYRRHIEDRVCPTGTCTPARARRYETMAQP